MSKVTVADITVDRCNTCAGLWFDFTELGPLAAMPHSERMLDTGDPGLGKSMNQAKNLDCPRCHARLIRMVAPQQAHVHYDNCSVCHGSFFDAGEFTDYKNLTLAERVQSFINQIRK
jgi:Zn-finger nucleic acid-binding protein